MVCTSSIALGNFLKRRRRMYLWSHQHAPCILSQGGFRLPDEAKRLAQSIKGKMTAAAYLFDIRNLWCKALRDLWNNFLNQSLVLHRLSRFHDSKQNKVQLRRTDKTKCTTYRTIVAWITYLRSSSTALRTSADSALTSALIGKFKLTRIFFDLKSNPNENEFSWTGQNTFPLLTWVQIILFVFIVDKNLCLH